MSDIHAEICKELFARLPKHQVEIVMSGEAPADIDPEFLGFMQIYKNLSEIIPRHFRVVDLGCSYAPQCFYFEGHDSYIGVDIGKGPRFEAVNTKHVVSEIKPFCEEAAQTVGDGVPVFAICSYVPNWFANNREAVRNTFDNVFTFYPCRTPIWSTT